MTTKRVPLVCLALASLFCTAVPAGAAEEAAPAVPAPAPQAPAINLRLYQVKYATPNDLVTILKQLVPSVQALLGPQPKFVRDTLVGESLGVDVTRAKIAAAIVEAPSTSVPDQFVRFLILNGADSDLDAAMKVLETVDLPAPQVLIEAQLLDVDDRTASNLGIVWDFAPNGTTVDFSLPSNAGIFTGKLERAPIEFSATLQAAITDGKVRILAKPRLMVLYNQRARIFIGDEITYLLGTTSSANGTTLETGQVSVGVELNVTALGNPDGTINLKVRPEVGNLLNLETLANGITLPQISRRTVTTAVRLKDGETMAIGGLIGSRTINATRKVPLLGDIPLLGQLFRRNVKEKSQTELIILLRASIVKDGVAPNPAEAVEAARHDLMDPAAKPAPTP